MSEEDKKPQPPEKPTTKTSTVPLKKETVRITLRAKPGAGTEGAPAAPAPKPPAPPAPRPPAPPTPAGVAPKPPAPPTPAGVAPKPPAPAPPAPPKPPSAAPPPPAGAKTVPLTPAPPAGTPAPPAGAKTVPLTQAPPPAGPAVGQQTAKLQSPPPGGAPGTRPLPKATVKLAPTQPIASSPTASIASAPIKGGVASQVLADDEAEEESGITPFAAICLVLAIAVLVIEVLTSQNIFQQDKRGDPSFAVPFENNPYHKENASGDLLPTFKAPEIPNYEPYPSARNPAISADD